MKRETHAEEVPPASDARPTDDYRSLQAYTVEQVVHELRAPSRELSRLLGYLPKVDSQGRSACPFSESMYKRKNKLEAKVAEAVASLRGMLPTIKEETARCRRNLDRISVDAGKLLKSAAQEKYATARTLQESEFLSVSWLRDRVLSALQEAEALLTASRAKVHPLVPAEDATQRATLPPTSSIHHTAPGMPVGANELFKLGRLKPDDAAHLGYR